MYDNSIVTLLSGNEVEFNRTFKFKNVVKLKISIPNKYPATAEKTTVIDNLNFNS